MAFAVQADVREPGPTQAMIGAVKARWGDPDILVLNADVGGFRPTPFSELTADDYGKRINNEMAAAVVPIGAVLSAMTARGSGCILAISSALCRAPVPGFSLLSTSKAALEALVRSLAIEFGPLGIRVNTIEASMIDGDNSGVVDGRSGQVEGRRAAGFINGASIPINGGQVMY
jgi:3-oxoacyl-[acyl-carrier protein] reductase